jgi:hypothetical protein
MRGKIGVVPQEPMYKVPESGELYSPPGLGKFPPGSSLPVRNSPRSFVPDQEVQPPKHFLEWAQARLLRHADRLVAFANDYMRLVEEYQGESTESPEGATSLSVIADYSPASELITEVLVCGPPQTPFTLQLGSRYLTLTTNQQGVLLLSPVSFKLKPDDQRILTAPSTDTNVSQNNSGTLTSPGANANIAIISGLNPNQVYTVYATIGLSGTTADGTDNHNVRITGVVSTTLGNISGVGLQTFGPFQVLPTAGGSLILQTVAAGSAGSIYTGGIFIQSLTPAYSDSAANWFLHLSGRVISNRSYT